MIIKYYFKERELDYALIRKEEFAYSIKNINSINAYEFYKSIKEVKPNTTIKFYLER